MNINRRNILIAAGIAGLAGYCIVLSLLVGLFTQPEAGTDPRFGALEISVANGDTDPMDEKGIPSLPIWTKSFCAGNSRSLGSSNSSPSTKPLWLREEFLDQPARKLFWTSLKIMPPMNR